MKRPVYGRVNPYQSEKIWRASLRPNENERRRIHAFHSMIPGNVTKVLDLGCGTGAISNELSTDTIVGVDITLVALRLSRNEKVLADATMLPFRERSFDLVICSELLEHLPDGSHAKAVQEINRLHPGSILLSVPFKEDLELRSSLCKKCKIYFNVYHHHRSYIPDDCDRLFERYTRDRTEFVTYIASASKWVISLGRRFGYYSVTPGEICDRCGSAVEYPPIAVRIVFGSLRYLSLCLNRVLEKSRPYHMILRYLEA